MKHSIHTITVALCLPALCSANSATVLKTEIHALVIAATPADQGAAIDTLVSNAWKAKAAKESDEIVKFRRADVQSGAASGSSGSTSAVSSPFLPAIFGFAFESGGITRTVSGNTITLKANPAALICASNAAPGVAEAVARRDADVCKTFWKRFGVTASFDTSRGDKSTSLANLNAVTNQFTDFTTRFEVLNHRITRSETDFESLANVLNNEVASFYLVHATFSSDVEKAINDARMKVGWDALSEADKEDRIAKAIDAVVPDTSSISAAWLAAVKGYSRAIANKDVVSLEYGYQQPDLATAAIGNTVAVGTRPPNLHSARLIYARGVGNLDFTMNASASWFNEIRPGMSGAWRDVRAGIEGKFKLRQIPNYGVPTLSFAGLFVHLHQAPLGIAVTSIDGTKINTPGNIGIFQTKLEFPTANNSMRIPVSFTYSNRTELIKENDVRGQIGISFDLGSLFGAQ